MKQESRPADIKAPDGFVLGGLRRVRADGTILFQRTYWRAPPEWAGQMVWVHESLARRYAAISVAPPGQQIYHARSQGRAVECEIMERPGAAAWYRKASNKAWAGRGIFWGTIKILLYFGLPFRACSA